MNCSNPFIFIIGISRTGSKFYMQLLNSHHDIHICPELLFQHPSKKCLERELQKAINIKMNSDAIAKLIFSIRLKDTYKSTLELIGFNNFSDYLSSLPSISPLDVFQGILQLSSSGKSIVGAKFPVHYSYTHNLFNHFNHSKVIFIIRDPRQIFASDIFNKKKQLAKTGNSFIPLFAVRLFVLFYTIFQWRGSMNTYEKLISVYGENRILLCKYESISSNPSLLVEQIATFLQLSSADFDLHSIKQVDSSFSSSDDRKKYSLSSIEKFIFRIFIGKQMRKYNYLPT